MLEAANIIILSVCVFASHGPYAVKSQARFDQFKVLRVNIPDEKTAQHIFHPGLKESFKILAEPRIGYYSDVMVAPDNMKKVIGNLRSMHLNFSVIIENVQRVMELELTPSRAWKKKSNADHPMTWTEYHSYSDIEAYMDFLAKNYPDFVSVVHIGTSYEGRPMRVLRICKGGSCGNKPAMWIDGGIHAREWIAPAVATYHMRELVENGRNQYLLDKLDWYILPLHNPDGYQYSRTSDRMWRKNR